MRYRCCRYGILLAGMTIGCAEKLPTTSVAEPAPVANPPVTEVAAVTPMSSAPKMTAKSPATDVPSETPIEPEITSEEPTVEIETEDDCEIASD